MREAILALVLCMFLSFLPVSLAGGYVDLTVLEAKDMIDSHLSLVVLDVRTQEEYFSGHIRNAKLIPLAELEGRLGELEATSETLVYCGVGGRSATASQILADNGFLHVYNMLGGITAWKNAGYAAYVKYLSIQGAINETHMGDTLFVSQGLYAEHLNISKPLNLIGENGDTTVIDGEDSGTVVRVEADGVYITGFTMRRCGCPCGGNSGVYINEGHRNVNVTHNLVGQNGGYGISVEGCSNINLIHNTVADNNYGIRIDNSTYCTVVDNSISNSTNFGIYLSLSSNITFCGNDASNNAYGIGLFYSSNNTFYHNNVLNNTDQIYVYSSSDTWDNGCEGNYWSDYSGLDLDGDGVGDDYLPWAGVDKYPLVNLYWNPGDIDHDLNIDIFDVVRAGGAYGSVPSDPQWNPHCDITEPYGAINIYDLVTIAGSYGKEYGS